MAWSAYIKDTHVNQNVGIESELLDDDCKSHYEPTLESRIRRESRAGSRAKSKMTINLRAENERESKRIERRVESRRSNGQETKKCVMAEVR